MTTPDESTMQTSARLQRPAFVLERFFRGSARGWGTMYNRFGSLSAEFDVVARGRWDDAIRTLSLVEEYRFSDGHTDVLEWTIISEDADRYRGSEPRIRGAARGEQAGSTFRWQYVRDTPGAKGGSTRLRFDDCFRLMDDDLLLARASVSRFGIEIGVMSVLYRKDAA